MASIIDKIKEIQRNGNSDPNGAIQRISDGAVHSISKDVKTPSSALSGAKKKVVPGYNVGPSGSYVGPSRSYGGGGGGYVETPAPTPAPAEPAEDYAAYMQMILDEQNRVYQEQKAEAKKAYDAQQEQLRASTDNANLAIDKNRDTAVGSMQGDRQPSFWTAEPRDRAARIH